MDRKQRALRYFLTNAQAVPAAAQCSANNSNNSIFLRPTCLGLRDVKPCRAFKCLEYQTQKESLEL